MEKRKLLFSSILFFALSVFQTDRINAQMVGSNAYIKGTSVEIGLDGAGGFEGCNTTVSAPLPGMHLRTNSFGVPYFGFVANPQLNGWAGSNFDGDFFTPGTPENGWGLEVGSAGTSYGNNCNALNQIPGSLTSWTHVFNCYLADWQGNLTTGTNLHVKINYFLQETDLFYTTTVSITNNTAATIPDMYYYRNLDPDNNVILSGAYETQNTIESQPGSGCNIALVSATQTTPWNSYMGLAAIGTNWRATYGGFSNRDASDIWNGINSPGITPFVQTSGSTNFADEGIALAYRIQNLAPGATETFKFVVILSSAQAANAVNNLMYLSYPGSASAPPSVCTPYTDTVKICAGAPATIAVNGSIVSNFNWSWSPGTGLSATTGSSVSASPASTTTYTLTGTPISPCVSPVTMTFVVKVSPPVTVTVPPNGNYCVGNTVPAASFTSTPSGATYTWTNSNPAIGLVASGTGGVPSFTATNGTASPISGTITVTPTAAGGGCTGTPGTYTITVNPGPAITVNSATSCPSQPVILTASGGSTYLWNTGSTANPYTVSPATTTSYTVTGTTAGCSGSAVATVTIGGSIAVSVNSPTICAGQSATLTPSGGTSYVWNTGSTASTLSVTPAVTTSYTVTGTAGGCSGSAVSTVTVNPNPTVTPLANVIACNGSAAAAISLASSPAGATFAWTNSDATIGLAASGSGPIPSFTATNTGSAPVTATITVTPTLAGCTGTPSTFTITVNPTPSVTVPSNITVCNGSPVSATSFTSPVTGTTYTWTNSNPAIGIPASGSGDIAMFNGTNSTSASITGTIVVTPTANGCTGPTGTYTITVDPTPVTSVPANIVICNGGSISASAFVSTPAGGTFGWTNSDPTIGLTANGIGNTPAFTATNTGTSAVTATVTVIPMVNGCVGTPNTYTITVNPTPAAPTAPGTATCVNTTATLTATAPGGTYTWYDAASGGTLLTTGASYTTPSLTTGVTYYVQTTDAMGCVSPMTSVPVAIAPGLTVDAGLNDTICFGDSTVLSVTPNGMGYTYSWSPAASLSSSNVYNPTAHPSVTTTYYVTVTSPAGCVGNDSVTVLADPQINLAVAGLPANCNGASDGQTIVIPNGGTGPYAYAWTGTSGCTLAACNQPAGNYTVTVTDAWGCTSTGTATVTEPTAVTATTTQVNTTCFGSCNGTATATGAGGTPTASGTYNYSWNTVPVQNTQTAAGLCAGAYICTVSDANGCSAIVTVTITEPTAVSIAPHSDVTICNSGSTTLATTVTGGTGVTYTYDWTTGTGLNDSTIASPVASPAITTTYSLTVTDGNGCADHDTVVVTVNPPLSVVTAGTASICPGANTPISAVASNGSGSGYTYSWTPATGLDSANVSGPVAGPAATTTYTVVASDGCSPAVTSTVTVTVLPLPVPVITSNITSGCSPLCVNFTDASTISSGSVAGWSWNFGDASSTAPGFGPTPSHCFTSPGTYTITLTDTSAAGCIATSTVPYLITVDPDPHASAVAPASTSIVNPIVPFTDQSTVATGSVVAWDWAFNDTFATPANDSSNMQNPIHTFSEVGEYCAELIVTSSAGCRDTTTVCIVIDPEFTFFIPNAFSPNDDGINDEFYGKGDFIKDYEMSIYDRWGNLIFHTDDINKHWNGKANNGGEVAQEDVYVYVIKLSDNKDKKHKYIGSVTIVK